MINENKVCNRFSNIWFHLFFSKVNCCMYWQQILPYCQLQQQKKKSLVNSKYKNLQPLRLGKKTNSLDFAALLLLLLSSLLLLHIYIYIYYFFIYSPISIYLCRAVNTLNFPAKTPIANLNYSNDIISLVLSFKLKVIHLLPKYSWYAHICNEIRKKKKRKKKGSNQKLQKQIAPHLNLKQKKQR